MESGAERWEARGIRKDKGRKQCGRIMREKACKDRKKGGKRDVESQRGRREECSISAPLLITHLSFHLQGLRGKACIVFISFGKDDKWSLT